MSNYQTVIDLVNKLSGKKDWSTQIYITITHDPMEGLLLDRIVWWSDKSARDDGFFWKKAEEWEAELCLSYAQVTRLTKNLQDKGLIETTKKRAMGAPTIHYKPVMPTILNSIKSNLEKVEIQEDRNSEDGTLEIEESSKSDFQESSKSLTAKTIKDSSNLLPKGNGAIAQQPLGQGPEENLLPDTPELLLLFEKINRNRKANNQRLSQKFGSIDQKQSFQESATKLGIKEFEAGITKGLKRGITSFSGLESWLAGWLAKSKNKKGGRQNGQKPIRASEPGIIEAAQRASGDSGEWSDSPGSGDDGGPGDAYGPDASAGPGTGLLAGH